MQPIYQIVIFEGTVFFPCIYSALETITEQLTPKRIYVIEHLLFTFVVEDASCFEGLALFPLTRLDLAPSVSICLFSCKSSCSNICEVLYCCLADDSIYEHFHDLAKFNPSFSKTSR